MNSAFKSTGWYNGNDFRRIAQRIRASNMSNVLSMAHPNTIYKLASEYINPYSYYDLKEKDNTYKTMLYGIEIKSCKIMLPDQLFLFPYEFRDGFPHIGEYSGIIQFIT